MKIAILSSSSQSLATLSALLESDNAGRRITRHEGGMAELRNVAEQGRPDLIIIDGTCRDAADLAIVEQLTMQYPQLFIVMLSAQQDAELLINAMRAGVREVLPSPATREALAAAVLRAESRAGLRNTPRRATVIAFIAAKGGSGATFLAANVGHQLGEEGRKTLLIDLNLQFGEALMLLHDRKAGSDIAEVARNLARMDASFLGASAVPISAQFSILAAPDDPAQALEVKPEHIDAILDLASANYDYIILDVSRNLDDFAVKALDRAGKIFLVTQTLLPCIRNAHRMMSVFRSLGYPQEKIEVLVNRHARNGEIGLEEIRASLGIAKLHTLPNAYKEVAKAINLGLPLSAVGKASPLFRALAELTLSLQSKPGTPPGGLLSRLLRHSPGRPS